ncbi:AarF/UbiB family protein [Carnobacterium sp.]|uniref:ABC1 kinase family protein n=1 Tax=Carnobacterium sp. TaxID=48221 RepID=UPI0028B22FD6|nr:AarF/UbiB family protein [Carnobacterium sp.]
MKKSERFREIISVLAAYGFGHMYNTKIHSQKKEADPQNLRKAFEELGPSFIKMGQIISTRRDILPKAYIEELAKLQDAAPPFPFHEVRQNFKEDFDQELEEVFELVEEKPIASASIAQVHKGRLLSGEEVILKVQRPGIEESFLRDIDLFIKIVSKAETILKGIVVDPISVFQEIRKTTKIELDFRNEVDYMVKFKELNADIACVNAPKAFTEFSSKRIIVQEYIDGLKITHTTELLQEGYDLNDIGQKLLLSYLSQVFHDGFFHGDPHPGNMIIKEGKIYYIDFGIMGELSNANKEVLNQLLKAIVLKDINQLVSLILQMGNQKGRVDRNELYDDLTYVFDTYFSTDLSNIRIASVWTDIFEITSRHRLSLPSDLVTLVKALTILEGTITDLAPEANLIKITKSYLKTSGTFSVRDLIDTEEALLQTYQFFSHSSKLPSQLSAFLDGLISGRSKFKIDLINMDEKWTGINKMVNRLVFALIISALIMASTVIIVATKGTQLSIIGMAGFLVAGFLGLWLLVAIIRSGSL